jgi:hypothetical protein
MGTCKRLLVKYNLSMPAFAILVHNEPQRLLQLLRTLVGFETYIHIDKFADRASIISTLQGIDLKTTFIIPESQSIGGAWGGYSLVEIQLKLIEVFLSKTEVNGPLVFLSGQDLPIKPLADFKSYLETKDHFISLQIIDKEKIAERESTEIARINRIRHFHLQDFRLFRYSKDRDSIRYKIGSAPSAITRRLRLPNFIFDSAKDYFIGSQWIGLGKEECKILLVERDLLRSEFRYSFCPDEIAIQTFFGRKLFNNYRVTSEYETNFDSIIDAEFHQIHPSLNHVWQIDELCLILKSSKFFIRKPSLELSDYIRKNLV